MCVVERKRNSKAGDKFGEAKTAGYYMYKASRVVASISIWIGQPTTHQNGCVFKCKRISVD